MRRDLAPQHRSPSWTAAVILAALTLACDPGTRPLERLTVAPVLFVPSDATLDEAEGAAALDRLGQHLTIARDRYRALLGSDTFAFSEGRVHRAAHDTAHYSAAQPDSAHAMTGELLEATGEDRNSSRRILVAVLVRAAGKSCGGAAACVGGGRTFNGLPGSGGGVVQLERQSLDADAPYPFQSTLVHELGHAFGLTHSDCLGEQLSSGRSIMSYNPAHHSSGLKESATPGELLPEEYFLLAENRLAFPAFAYDEARHNPTGRQLVGADGTCELRAMDPSLGAMARKGYQLFFGGELVSGPDAQFFTRGEARANCRFNVESQPGVEVRCLFDGARIGGSG